MQNTKSVNALLTPPILAKYLEHLLSDQARLELGHAMDQIAYARVTEKQDQSSLDPYIVSNH